MLTLKFGGGVQVLKMSPLPLSLSHPELESGPPPPPPPHRSSTDSGTASSRSSDDLSTVSTGGDLGSSLSGTEIVGVSDKKRESSSVSECSVVVDLEDGPHQEKAHFSRDCRICHLSLEESGKGNGNGNGIPIELGCSCKADLAAAHKHCAEAWFKIKGNKTCEICGATAQNVVGANEADLMEQWNEANDAAPSTATATGGAMSETRNFWQGHRFLNFLLACMVFAFVISWLFHFNVPS